MKNEILDANEALVSKILYDFDHELQLKFSSSLFQFILATDEISYGMFHDTIRQVWRDAGLWVCAGILRQNLLTLRMYKLERHRKPARNRDIMET